MIDRFFESKKQAMAWVEKNPHFMKVRVLDSRHQVADMPATAAGPTTGAKSAAAEPTKIYSPDGAILPADTHSPLIPTIFGAALPKS